LADYNLDSQNEIENFDPILENTVFSRNISVVNESERSQDKNVKVDFLPMNENSKKFALILF
jgi:hypothetical protein